MKLQAIVCILLVGVYAEDIEEPFENSITKEAIEFVHKCGTKEITICLKERALQYVDKLPQRIEIGGGLSLEQNNDVIDRSPRDYSIPNLPEESRAREEAIDSILYDKFVNYLSSHTLEFKVPEDTIAEFKNSIEEGRKKKGGKKGNMMAYLMLFKMKAAMLAALALKGLAIISFKALVIAKIALTITAIIGLKKLSESKHHSPTYEVVAHDEHGHYRSFGQELAYKGYKKESDSNTSS
ncbi:hypothetical protein FQA39_LY14798 [Lamprigera yunnana]|nr:hypothetical protein FQA39_LY14798 [Lamprigera yunnana]